jgi:predicted HicB family RNase H-like nuclease
MMPTEVAANDVKLMLRLPPELHQQLRRVAFEEDRSLNNLLVHIVRRWLAEQGREPEPKDRPD